jgi:hypothetical protein
MTDLHAFRIRTNERRQNELVNKKPEASFFSEEVNINSMAVVASIFTPALIITEFQRLQDTTSSNPHTSEVR